MTTILSLLGIAAALLMAAVSLGMNYLFLFSLGKSPLEGQVLGVASAAADLLKCLLPFFIAKAWASKRKAAALSGSLVWAFFTAFSLLSAIGFAADNRGAVSEARAALSDQLKGLEGDLKAAQDKRAALPAHRPAAIVAAALRAHEQNRRWASSKECHEATTSESRAFCTAYFDLKAEAAAAQAQEKFDAEIAALKAKIASLRQAGAGENSDPQLSLLSRIFAAHQDKVRLTLIILIALLVEAGSSLGLYLASGHGAQTKRSDPAPASEASPPEPLLIEAKPIGSIEDFCLEALVPMPQGSLSADQLYAGYADWCQARDYTALDRATFIRLFDNLATAIPIVQANGHWQRLALRDAGRLPLDP